MLMDKRKWNLTVHICLAVLWLAVIWGNSLLSGESSSQVSGWAGQLLQKLLPALSLDTEEGMHLLRKTAHFTEFAILGVLLLRLTGLIGQPVRSAALWGITAAAVDETIQRFTEGRTGCLQDVLLDSTGVLAGVALYLAVRWVWWYIITKIQRK